VNISHVGTFSFGVGIGWFGTAKCFRAIENVDWGILALFVIAGVVAILHQQFPATENPQ